MLETGFVEVPKANKEYKKRDSFGLLLFTQGKVQFTETRHTVEICVPLFKAETT